MGSKAAGELGGNKGTARPLCCQAAVPVRLSAQGGAYGWDSKVHCAPCWCLHEAGVKRAR